MRDQTAASTPTYDKPELEHFGTVRELTQVGCTNPAGDFMGGSVAGPGGFPGKGNPPSCPF